MSIDWEDDAQVSAQWFKWTVEIEVNGIWVRDGFELTEERLNDMIAHQLPYSYDNETRVRIVKSPDPARLKESQGYWHSRGMVATSGDEERLVRHSSDQPKTASRSDDQNAPEAT